jgi:Fe-S-cluster containining protein
MNDERSRKSADEEQERLQQKILEENPRLGPDDKFTFDCHPGVSCFNLCCRDVNIFLTPYDVLRLKSRLGMKSYDFLEKYTLLPIQKDMKTPTVLLKMNNDEGKTCQFVTERGCGVYTDRPWPCRMYPLGLAAQRDTEDGWQGDRFYFLLREEVCRGFGESREWTVREYLDSQQVEAYDEWGEGYKELTLHKFFENGGSLTPQKMHMFYTACYDLDKFREFVFESTMLQRFDIDEDLVEEMRSSDEALLKFAFLWLRFSLFGEKTFRVKGNVLEAFQGRLDKKEIFPTRATEDPEEET